MLGECHRHLGVKWQIWDDSTAAWALGQRPRTSREGLAGVQAEDLGTTDATSSDNQVQEATLGSAGNQSQKSLAVGSGDLVPYLDQDGRMHRLKGQQVPETVGVVGERPSLSRPGVPGGLPWRPN